MLNLSHLSQPSPMVELEIVILLRDWTGFGQQRTSYQKFKKIDLGWYLMTSLITPLQCYNQNLKVNKDAILSSSITTGVQCTGLWSSLIYEKYLKHLSLVQWIRAQLLTLRNASNVSTTLVRSFSIIGDWVIWRIGNGKQVQVGTIIGPVKIKNKKLSDELIKALNMKGIYTLYDAVYLSFCHNFFDINRIQHIVLLDRVTA